MTHISGTLIVEGFSDVNSHVIGLTVIATALLTTTLTSASTSQYVFTGSTVGTITKLPDATTLRVGLIYQMMNISTVPITVQYNNATTLVTLAASDTVTIVLQNNGTTNGIWVIRKSISGATSGNAMPMYFGAGGNANDAYLNEATASNASYTSDLISPAFPRPCAIVGYSIKSVSTTLGQSWNIILREGAALGVDKYTIGITGTTTFVSGWSALGFTTFAAGERPAIFSDRLGSGNLVTPRVVIYYAWTD